MQKTRVQDQTLPPELNVGLMRTENDQAAPAVGEGVSADSLVRFVSAGGDALSANFAHMSMARSMLKDGDPKVTDGFDRLAQLTRRQHELLAAFGERALKSGKNEL